MNPVRIILLFSIISSLFFALIPHVLWLVGWLVSLIFGHHLRYAPFGWTALALVVVLLLALAYGFSIGRWNLKVKPVEYENKEIPAEFDGFRIVHISDLHLSTFNDKPAQLKRFVEAINEQNPDLVCFTGDLVTMTNSEAQPYTDILRQISARHGVVSVLGNHDFHIYGNNFNDNQRRMNSVAELADYERDTLGWQLLRNSSVKITAPSSTGDTPIITIVGIDNKNGTGQGFQTINSGDIPQALEGTSGFRILLSHDPSLWEAEVVPSTDIQLTLSGHTHAAQLGLFGWNAASLMFRQSYGLYECDGQTIYVNPGLGCTLPFRLGARPEITVITLRSDSGSIR